MAELRLEWTVAVKQRMPPGVVLGGEHPIIGRGETPYEAYVSAHKALSLRVEQNDEYLEALTAAETEIAR